MDLLVVSMVFVACVIETSMGVLTEFKDRTIDCRVALPLVWKIYRCSDDWIWHVVRSEVAQSREAGESVLNASIVTVEELIRE